MLCSMHLHLFIVDCKTLTETAEWSDGELLAASAQTEVAPVVNLDLLTRLDDVSHVNIRVYLNKTRDTHVSDVHSMPYNLN